MHRPGWRDDGWESLASWPDLEALTRWLNDIVDGSVQSSPTTREAALRVLTDLVVRCRT